MKRRDLEQTNTVDDWAVIHLSVPVDWEDVDADFASQSKLCRRLSWLAEQTTRHIHWRHHSARSTIQQICLYTDDKIRYNLTTMSRTNMKIMTLSEYKSWLLGINIYVCYYWDKFSTLSGVSRTADRAISLSPWSSYTSWAMRQWQPSSSSSSSAAVAECKRHSIVCSCLPSTRSSTQPTGQSHSTSLFTIQQNDNRQDSDTLDRQLEQIAAAANVYCTFRNVYFTSSYFTTQNIYRRRIEYWNIKMSSRDARCD